MHGRGTGQRAQRYLQLGVAGPVGTGKSSVIAAICRHLRDEFAIGVITNDIYTDEDARFLKSKGVRPEKRIRAVETGFCPHTAIRDDRSGYAKGAKPGAVEGDSTL